MATLNLKAVGGLTKIEYTGQADQYLKVQSLSFIEPNDGTTFIIVDINGTRYKLDAIGDIHVDGSPCSSQADFETKIATVFLDANSGNGGSGGGDGTGGDAATVETHFVDVTSLTYDKYYIPASEANEVFVFLKDDTGNPVPGEILLGLPSESDVPVNQKIFIYAFGSTLNGNALTTEPSVNRGNNSSTISSANSEARMQVLFMNVDGWWRLK